MSNMSSLPDSEIGGLAYFLVHISDYLPYVIIVSTGTVVGVIGNILIMLTIVINKELHSETYMLIFNLSLADIVISGFVDSSSVISVFIGEKFFDDRPSLCVFIGAICLIACSTSLVNLGFLSINRYVHICHNNLYKKLFSKKLTLLYCLITWLCGFFVDFPNLVGWGNHSFDTKTLSCVWDRLASLSYSYFLMLTCIVTPCVAIFFCYMRIFVYSYKSKSKSNSSSKSHSLRLAQGLFASFMIFTICWLPYGLIVMIDFQDRFPRSAIMFAMAFGHLNSSLNPILYAIFNPAFRRGYINLFNKIICCAPFFTLSSNKVSNSNTNTEKHMRTNNQTKSQTAFSLHTSTLNK